MEADIVDTLEPGTAVWRWTSPRTKLGQVKRLITLLLVLSTACTASADPVSETAGPAALSLGSGRAFDTVYNYPAGTTLEYRLGVRQDISFTTTGDQTVLAGDDSLPDSGRVITDATTTIAYVISEESTADATTIDMSAFFEDPTTSAKVGDTELDPEVYDELTRALAAVQPIDFTVGVNDRNAVLTTGGLGGLDVLNGEVGALTSLSNNQLSRPLGPVFPEDRRVKLGQEWHTETSEEGPSGPIVVSTTYRVTEEIETETETENTTVLVIESVTETDGFELDFSDVFQSLFADFASGQAGRELTESDLEQFSEVRFVINVQPSTGTAQTLFDVTAGRVVSSIQSSQVTLKWSVDTPDPSGGITGFELNLEIDQRADFTLLD